MAKKSSSVAKHGGQSKKKQRGSADQEHDGKHKKKNEANTANGSSDLMVRVNHRGITSREFSDTLETKLTHHRHSIKQLLRHNSSAPAADGRSYRNTQILIQAQNNHLTDDVFPVLAKTIQAYVDLVSSVLQHTRSTKQRMTQFEFNFSGNELGGGNIQELLEVILSVAQVSLVNIKTLNLGWNHIANETAMKKLGRFVAEMNFHNYEDKDEKRRQKQNDRNSSGQDSKHSPRKIEENCIQLLNLAKTGLDSTALAAFCNSSQSFGCISSLLLYQNRLTRPRVMTITSEPSDGLIALQNKLSNRRCTLTELNLAENTIGDMGAYCIASALRKNKSLKILNLRGNGIELLGFRHICHALLENDTLESIDLSSNNYVVGNAPHHESIWSKHDEGLIALSEMLSKNQSLKSLSISQQALTELDITQFEQFIYDSNNWGFYFLFESLKSNRTLTHLDLRGNERLTHQSMKQLYSILCRHNTTLQSVNLSHLQDTVQQIVNMINTELNRRGGNELVVNNESHPVQKSKQLKFTKKSKLPDEVVMNPVAGHSTLPIMSPRGDIQSSIGDLGLLPIDLLLEICSFLSIRDILTMEFVNQGFYCILRRSDFIWKTQLSYYPNLVSFCQSIGHVEQSFRKTMQHALIVARGSVLSTISKSKSNTIPAEHSFKYLMLAHPVIHKPRFRINDLRVLSLARASQHTKLSTALYSHQYGVLAVLEQTHTIASLRMNSDIPYRGTNILFDYCSPQSNKSHSVNLITEGENVIVTVTSQEHDQYQFLISQQLWDKEWIRTIGVSRFHSSRSGYWNTK